ncbi:hypothetical protein B296_00004572 [Ensete ventricosum]|uniref:Uncharacterized protein n=1 Tax=Ensete ventricosum TaxID=4639 RepID=A0A427AIM4_ENSVE|nr:hypothetical protein B296_00004572 [Ensete ventricosum]
MVLPFVETESSKMRVREASGEPLAPLLLNQYGTKDGLIITLSTKGGKGSCPRCLAREYWSTKVHDSGPSF